MKFFFKPFAIFAVALAASASALAQFTTDVSGGAGSTTLAIKQVAPGKAELVLTGMQAVYVNHDPKIDGLKPKRDVSGKGNVWIVDPGTASDLAGAEICLSGVGRGGWAAGGGKIDRTKTSCAPMANNMTIPVSVDGRNSCFGLVPLVVKGDMAMKNVYGAHPTGDTNRMLTRANGAKDMVTVLCVDQAGVIAAPTADQAKVYDSVYQKVTGVAAN